MAQHWTSTYLLRWTPILTFVRRRLELLELMEARLDPIAFVDRPDAVGVALASKDLRVVARRGGMLVSTGLSGAGLENLHEAVQDVFEVLQPKDAVVSRARSVWSSRLPDADYNVERARLARELTGGADTGDFRPDDASALADFESRELHAQVEWGVVKRDELLQRLTADMGRATVPEEMREH